MYIDFMGKAKKKKVCVDCGMQKKPIRKAKGGDPMRDLRVTGEMWNLSVMEVRAPRNLPHFLCPGCPVPL